MSSTPLGADALLGTDETEALAAVLADVAQGHGNDAGVRDAASAGWALLCNRAAAMTGYGVERDPSDYQRWLDRMQRRDRPWRTRR